MLWGMSQKEVGAGVEIWNRCVTLENGFWDMAISLS